MLFTRSWQLGLRILWLTTLIVCGASAQADEVWLSSLDLSKVKVTDNVRPSVDKSIGGNPLSINGKTFERGVGLNGESIIYVRLDGGSDRFTAVAGVDDENASGARRGDGEGQGAADQAQVLTGERAGAAATPAGAQPTGRGRGRGGRGGGAAGPRSMSVRILDENARVLFQNNSIAPGADGAAIVADTRGAKLLAIFVGSGGGGGRRGGGAATAAVHYDLANAKFEVSGVRPTVVEVSGEAREVLTPKASPAPQINGPALTGVTAHRPFLYKIPASGAKPITYSATGMPDGLTLDPATGIITGEFKQRGTYPVKLTAKNSAGVATREFKIVVEGTLALTPPLGWNSWNARGRSVTDDLVRKTADAFVDKGLIDHGWTYICIDDGWERSPRETDDLYEGPTRDGDGRYITNRKFPDMKALGDYIHAKGLKYGIYSSPGPTTCQGLEASFGHEESDVAQWCEWGVDYLKYDWCSYRATESGVAGAQAPYRLMRSILDKAPRDIVYSICQYGRNNVWEWGNNPDIRGNLWRTTGDIRDNWPQTRDIGFNPRWSEVDLAQYAGPGHWNDVDMLVVGVVGWSYEPLHETKLTPAEQYTHISLWVLHAAPLILGCHLHEADNFTINLLTNAEVLAVSQDVMGRGAKAVWTSEDRQLQVWSRPLADGTKAVGLFNLNEVPLKVTAKWSDLGVDGPQVVRDLWRQKDLGQSNGEFTAEIARHGSLLLKLTPAATAP